MDLPDEVVQAAADTKPQSEPTLRLSPSTRSLAAKRSVSVRERPDFGSPLLGTLAQDVRVRWRGASAGPGCEGLWIEIEPRGFVCDAHLAENFRRPRALELPRVPAGSLVPGIYGSVDVRRARAFRTVQQARTGRGARRLQGLVSVKQRREITDRNRTLWRTAGGDVIDARFVRPYKPSFFQGVDLDEAGAFALPFAWTRRVRGAVAGVPVLPCAKCCSDPIGYLPPRIVVPVLERSAGGSAVRIGEHVWVDASHLHIAWPTVRPESAGPKERWIDVDLEEQVLVAWSGDKPVRATLISSGGPSSPTPEGLYRSWIKFAERDMRGEVRGRPYLVERVPWAVFFHGDFGFHAAYWHDRFGEPTSSGCINLSPIDARWLYFWSRPHVPAGWTMVYQSETTPGSLIRIRRGIEGFEKPPATEERWCEVLVAASTASPGSWIPTEVGH